MRKITVLIFVLSLILYLSAIETFAQAPNTIMYQGRLTNVDGAPLQQTVVDSVRFTIYAAPPTSSILYDTSVTDLTIDDNGIFTIELGPLPNRLFNGEKRYLGIKVNNDHEMSPRQPLTSVPYSVNTAAPTPIAMGVINADATIANGTGNFTCIRNQTDNRFEITIDGENYDCINYVALVTPLTAHTSATTCGNGDLYVYFLYAPSSDWRAIPFHFVVYKL